MNTKGEVVKKPKSQYKTTGLLKMRADKENIGVKSAALLDPQVIPKTLDLNRVATTLAGKLEQIPGHCPKIKHGSPATTPRKRPKYVTTPKGTRLDRDKDYGFILIFSIRKVIEVVRGEPNLFNVELKDVLKASVPNFNKSQYILVTDELIEQASNSVCKRGSGDIPDQQTTMALAGVDKKKASATKIAKLLNLQTRPDELFEWLHLIMFFLRKKAAQDPSNLTGGTKYANTDMMLGEDAALYLASLLGEDIEIFVDTTELGFHFSKEIRFTIVSKENDIALPFIFNAQTSVNPSIRNQSYLHAVVETIVEEINALFIPHKPKFSLDEPEPKTSVIADMPMLFFAVPKKLESTASEVSIKELKK